MAARARIFGGIALVLTLAGVAAFRTADRAAEVGAGYKAKILCSEVFLAGRPEAAVKKVEFEGIDPILDRISARTDADAQTVTASLLGLGRRRAVYREGYGCTLADSAPAPLPDFAPVAPAPWPRGAQAPGIEAALDAAMADGPAGHRALAVFQDGRLIAERYAEGFGPETPFLSWSMAKSVTATMIGAAVQRGHIDLDAAPPVDAWRAEGDPRREITWRDLLQMQSGLAFEEEYGSPFSDVNRMLFASASAAALAAASHAGAEPGAEWYYSSGATNILQRALRRTLEEAGVDYHRFARDAIFAPLGAASAVLEPDAAGDFVGSSFIYATARDWAKLGELHRRGGVWKGARILPENWAEFVTAPAAKSDRQYGAHFWLNRKGENGRPSYFPGLPQAAYLMSGHEGQYVVIVPDKALVIVRLGLTRGGDPAATAAPVFADIYAAAPTAGGGDGEDGDGTGGDGAGAGPQ